MATRSLALTFPLLCTAALAQGTAADYARAAALGEQPRVVRFAPRLHWLPADQPNGGGVWWAAGRGDERRFVVVDATGARREVATAPAGDAEANEPLQPIGAGARSRNGGDETSITLANHLDRAL